MGQTVLSMHKLGNRQYPAHTHFSKVSQNAANQGLRIPITDSSFVNRFSEVFRLKRGGPDCPWLSPSHIQTWNAEKQSKPPSGIISFPSFVVSLSLSSTIWCWTRQI